MALLDVIVPSSDGWKHLELCIQSVERFTRNDHRIIVVHSGTASPETRRVLDAAKKRGATVIELVSCESFSKAINAGLSVSSAKYVALLNDDCYVLDGWDAIMIAELSDSGVGLVGARSPGAAAGFQGSPEHAETVRVPFLVFTHVMTRRDVLDKVGKLDAETFDGWGSEDLDYSWRVTSAGYRLKVSAARSLHVGGATMERSGGQEGRAREYARMHRKLVEKWGEEHVRRESRLYPRVALCVPTYNGKVENDFFQSFALLEKTGPFQVELFQTKRLTVHYARERIAEAVIEAGFDYIWWLDDDMTFPPDTLIRLMRHKKPVVTALAYQRKEPYLPCIFEWESLAGKEPVHQNGRSAEGYAGHFKHLENWEHTGLRKIDGCGSACVLTEVDVFTKLDRAKKRPFFDNKKFGEDLHFARSCMELEPRVQLYCDTDLIIGHIGEPVVVDEALVARYKMHKRAQAQNQLLVNAP